ncbi:lysophospholipase [Hoeflea sp. WL0058]|uniref:Lysophospholipase n=1 Tax=Flavimaribacter sediminis TaxID=2865987 RepID=A0AAE3CZH9_9HYPH|nr:alpha/beta hydrolase [Flavimaribacter sediminis]MBW8635947.1 lysophospholipase [Flavimaribacter sediminis]
MAKILRNILNLVVIAVVLYAAAAGFLYATQRDHVFIPSGALSDPVDEGLEGVIVENVTMADGVVVTVWRAEPARHDLPTVLYFQGNGGNISTRATRFQQIMESGLGFYAPAYRGYPGSEGSPSEEMFISDALHHFDRADAISSGVILHGESLGTGVATAVAAERDAEALILEAPFTATVDIAASAYPWLPVSFLMKDQFKSRDRIIDVTEPVLILHGTDDRVVPFAQGQALYELANDPKQFALFEDAGHTELWRLGLRDRMLEFLKRHELVERSNLPVGDN